MPRRSILTAAKYDSLVAIPDARDELIRLYTFSDANLALVSQRHGPANRLGFAVQLCYLRFPGACRWLTSARSASLKVYNRISSSRASGIATCCRIRQP